MSATPQATGLAETSSFDLDLTVARLLNIGTVTAVGIMAFGVLLMVVQGQSPLEQPFPPLDLAALPGEILALEPAGFLWLGLIAVIGTPILRVVMSLLGYWRERELRMVWISAGTLGVIGLSVVLALVFR